MCKDLDEKVSGTVLILNVEDKLCWSYDKVGESMVKKRTELFLMYDEADANLDCCKVWNIKVPPRVRSFRWMLAIDRIPSMEFLSKRGMNIQNFSIFCPWCRREPESAYHIFFKCRFIDGFWAKIFDWWDVG
ncbi:hypothetical protein J1N35_012540 [Gossypium stocksii]|uniref:Reverse transcriptase zinc-binding domain-containing protein n=1 Tax=Gossypium stocksii TaxID=47602 RepID=A0A9D3W4S0_9ROSI|nr:hypothetical protein J1N35_012540 [Gossypium stocksii]